MVTTPAIFINHGAGPMPLMGRQPHLVQHMKDVVKKILPEKPKAIVVLSAHWEEGDTSNSLVRVTSNDKSRSLYYDYGGFPPEMYKLDYPAPGNPILSERIQALLLQEGTGIQKVQLDCKRGFDHGVFVPLLIMFPKADIPVISVSMHASLDPEANMNIGSALAPLREEGILILGSGLTFHNFNTGIRPTPKSVGDAHNFTNWLKETLGESSHLSPEERKQRLNQWEDQAPGGRACHPREDHLIPLFMTAAAGNFSGGQVIYDTAVDKSPDPFSDHPLIGFAFV